MARGPLRNNFNTTAGDGETGVEITPIEELGKGHSFSSTDLMQIEASTVPMSVEVTTASADDVSTLSS